MSQRYGANEPPTSGKVVLTTTLGDFDVELWSKEAPLACRNFVQLCLEEYFDSQVFHRVIKDFVAQTGDPTGEGDSGESIYGGSFKDEFHSRLRFSHPGILAMASEANKVNDNRSQWFVTLAACEHLNKKHSIFGKVTGNTIYNVMKFNDVEVEGSRPLDPMPRIISTKVLFNPFPDIVPRPSKTTVKRSEIDAVEKAATARKKRNRKHEKKDTRLVSFGDPDDEEALDIKITYGKKTSKRKASRRDSNSAITSTTTRMNLSQESSPEIASKGPPSIDRRSYPANSEKRNTECEMEHGHIQHLKSKELEKSPALMENKTDVKSAAEESMKDSAIDVENELSIMVEKKQKIKQLVGELSKEKASDSFNLAIKQKKGQRQKSILQMRREKYLKTNVNRQKRASRENDTLMMLASFTDKLQKHTGSLRPKEVSVEESVDHYAGGIGENLMEDEGITPENGEEWMGTELRFRKHIDDKFRLGEKNVSPEELVVIDAETDEGYKQLENLATSP